MMIKAVIDWRSIGEIEIYMDCKCDMRSFVRVDEDGGYVTCPHCGTTYILHNNVGMSEVEDEG